MGCKLVFLMANGDVFTKSSFKGSTFVTPGHVSTHVLPELSRAVWTPVDGDAVIWFSQVSTAWIVEDRAVSEFVRQHTKKREEAGPLLGTCACCGQRFVESTRQRPRVGTTWTAVLEPYSRDGTCPLCCNTFGRLQGGEVPWTNEEWREYLVSGLASASSTSDLAEVERRVGGRVPLASEMIERRRVELAAEAEAEAEAKNRHAALLSRIQATTALYDFRALEDELECFPDLAAIAHARKAHFVAISEQRRLKAALDQCLSIEDLDALAPGLVGFDELLQQASDKTRELLVVAIERASAIDELERLNAACKTRGWEDLADFAVERRLDLSAKTRVTERLY